MDVRNKFGGKMGELYKTEVKISRGEDARKYVVNSDQPFGLYAKIKSGHWLHRNLLSNKTPSENISEAILHYMENGRVKFNVRENTLEDSATIRAEDRRCLLSVKENGVHIMITVERQPDRAWKIKDVCGKQGPFDDVNARTGAFKSVVYGLLHNATFDFLPDDANCVLLQAELVVPRTFMRLTNQHDVTSLVFSYGKACSDQDKHEILNKLELRFFNAGGLSFDPVDHSTTYERYTLDKVSSILAQLVETEYSPQYAKGTTRKLRVCSSLYFDKNDISSSDDWETCVADITEFVFKYQNQEGFIFRAEGCQWIKYKRVYTDKLGAVTRVPGCVVPVLIGPSNNLDAIEGVVVAPPLKHGGTECKELLTIVFGIEHDPEGETGVYYKGGAKWSGLDYLRSVLSRGRIVQHTQTARDHKCTYRVATPDGRELVYHCRNLGKLGHRVAFVCIGEGVEPCFCVKFNELITNPDRDVMLDTAVLMSFVVPGGPNRDLESKSLTELIEIMTPPHDYHIHRELTTQTKVFFNSLIPGSLQRRSDYAHDLPWDLYKQDAFLSGIVSCYEDFQKGKVTDVPLTKRYLLAAKHHREGAAAVAQPFPGFQFRQAPRIRFNRASETTQQQSPQPSPIETPPPAVRALPAPVTPTTRALAAPETFTITKTAASCGIHNNTAWNELNALRKAGRKFGISDMTPEQLSKLFEYTADRIDKKEETKWKRAMDLLRHHKSLQPHEKSFLTLKVDILVCLITPDEVKRVLFDENGRERDKVVHCVRRPIVESEWIEIARRAEPVQNSTQIDLTDEQVPDASTTDIEVTVEPDKQMPDASTTDIEVTVEPDKQMPDASTTDIEVTVEPASAKRKRSTSPQPDEEDLYVGDGATSMRSRYV
jgi:hypothetical protein